MDDVDVFVGLVSETHVAGSLVGPTLACLLGSQFEDIKFGDRFFYETRAQEEGFTDGSSSNFLVPYQFLTQTHCSANNEEEEQIFSRLAVKITRTHARTHARTF